MSLHDKSPGAAFLTRLFDQTLQAAAASFDTGAILPGEFSALEILFYARGDTSAQQVQGALTFNGDSGSNYDWAIIRDTGNTSSATGSTTAANITAAYVPAATATANCFGSSRFVIPSYSNTTGFKAGTGQFGYHPGAGGTAGAEMWNMTFQWRSTAAINRIILACNSGNWVAGSRLLIYGLP